MTVAATALEPIVVPREHVNDDSVFLTEWAVADGTRVEAGAVVCSIETSKAIVEPPHARAATRRLERVLPYLLIAPVMIYMVVVLVLPLLIQIFYSFLTREQGTYTFHIVQKFTLDNYNDVIFGESAQSSSDCQPIVLPRVRSVSRKSR